jgi:hypothetical protein
MIEDSQEILDSELVEVEKEEYDLVTLNRRAIAFLLDYGLLIALINYSYKFVEIFFNEVPEALVYVLIVMYCLIFVLLEYKNDGSIFKRLLKIKTVSIEGDKIGIHIYLIKLILRPIAFFIAIIYLKFCTIILLWFFGIYKPLFRFLRGEIYALWYDLTISQMTVKMKEKGLKYSFTS